MSLAEILETVPGRRAYECRLGFSTALAEDDFYTITEFRDFSFSYDGCYVCFVVGLALFRKQAEATLAVLVDGLAVGEDGSADEASDFGEGLADDGAGDADTFSEAVRRLAF